MTTRQSDEKSERRFIYLHQCESKLQSLIAQINMLNIRNFRNRGPRCSEDRLSMLHAAGQQDFPRPQIADATASSGDSRELH
jgi:hypothetical protein